MERDTNLIWLYPHTQTIGTPISEGWLQGGPEIYENLQFNGGSVDKAENINHTYNSKNQ